MPESSSRASERNHLPREQPSTGTGSTTNSPHLEFDSRSKQAAEKMAHKTAPALRPPQFGMRTLLIAMGFCGVFCALATWVSPYVLFVLILLMLAIGAHVMGNAMGSRLREIGDESKSQGHDHQVRQDSAHRFNARPQPHEFAPHTRLSKRASLGWISLLTTIAGAIVGGLLGGFGLAMLSWELANPLNLTITSISASVLGGLLGFVTGSFAEVASGALVQARGKRPRP